MTLGTVRLFSAIRDGTHFSWCRTCSRATVRRVAPVEMGAGTANLDERVPRNRGTGSVRHEELRAHFRYPEDLFTVQREMIAKYHVDDPREFFTTNAFWSVPSDPIVDDNPHQPPFDVLVGDRGTAQPSFRPAGAMVGHNREFLSSYISAHSDPENYGKISVLQLPTDTLTQGPQQVQNSVISHSRSEESPPRTVRRRMRPRLSS